MDDTAFSRTGRTSTQGKMTARLDIPVSEELEAAVITMATLAGVPRAEFARRLLERALFGEFNIARSVAAAASGGNSTMFGGLSE